MARLADDLRVAVMRLSRRLRQEQADDDISPGSLGVLFALMHQGPMTPGALAAREQVRPPSMTRTIDALERAGLVERSAHPQDRRQVLVSGTEQAARIVTETRRRRTAWLTRRLQSLSAQDRAVLAQAATILDRLTSP